ncbi:hypothetical protein BH23CYA1_BH23CYA1_16500 [soil metagenome]
MHSSKFSESPELSTHVSDENSTPSAPSDQTDCSDKDVMCLVYPDGKLTTVEFEPESD